MAFIQRPATLHPRQLLGLTAWWDFSDAATLGPLVSGTPSTVADKSGQGWALLADPVNTSPMRIRKSLTGRTAIDGATGSTNLGYESLLDVSAGELMVAYAAMYPAAVGTGQRVVANDHNGGNWLMGPYGDNWSLFNGGFVGSGGAFPVGAWAVHTGVISDSLGLSYHHGNGDLQGLSGGTGFPTKINIGWAFGEYPRVFLGEVLVLKTHDEATRLRVQDYLMRKWGAGSALHKANLLRPQTRRPFFIASSAINVSISETAATSDALTATLTATASRAETAATSDARTATLTATASRSESVATSDALTATLTAAASRSETAATSDALTATLTASRALAETAATSDALTATLTATAAVAETAATSDAFFVGIQPQAVSETAATSDALTATLTATAALAETAATSDAITAVLTATGAIAETAATSDAFTFGPQAQAISETAATSDAYTAVLTASALISETAATSDVFFVGSQPQVVSETAATSDAFTAVLIASAVLVETAATSDAFGGVLTASATLSESAATLDVYAGILVAFANVNEAAASADLVIGHMTATAMINEVAATKAIFTRPGDSTAYDFMFHPLF